MRKRDLKKFPIEPPPNGLRVAAYNLATKMKLSPCPRCGNNGDDPLRDVRPYVSNEQPPIFTVQCGICGIQTRGWLRMINAIWDWNGVYMRRKFHR